MHGKINMAFICVFISQIIKLKSNTGEYGYPTNILIKWVIVNWSCESLSSIYDILESLIANNNCALLK